MGIESCIVIFYTVVILDGWVVLHCVPDKCGVDASSIACFGALSLGIHNGLVFRLVSLEPTGRNVLG